MTEKEWIERANKIHKGKYDYSKIIYKGSKEKVCIICPKHGEFWQEANSHLKGCKCPKCSYEEQCYKDVNDFITKSNKIHNFKYDYSYVQFEKKSDKIKIVCPKHGEFITTPSIHLKGCECPKCAGNKKKNINDFITKSNKIHNFKYDYSKVKYQNNNTKVCVICPEHGEFWQIPYLHMKGSGCPCCAKNHKLNREDFIEKAKKIHGDKYDYSKVVYVGSKNKVCIICPEHGEFWQTPNAHLSGQGCLYCGVEGKSQKRLCTEKEFIEKANRIHNYTYDYSKIIYRGVDKQIEIICPKHGEFWQTPHSHLNGHGCQKCRESKLERDIRFLLEENNINYIYQASKKDLEWLGYLSFDFYLPDYNIAIECQGIQHFEPVDFVGKGEIWAKQSFEEGVRRDKIKASLAKENGVRIMYYSNIVGEDIINDKNEIIKWLM